jgi:hypothetical protein
LKCSAHLIGCSQPCAEECQHFSAIGATGSLETNEIEPFEVEKQNGSESKGG